MQLTEFADVHPDWHIIEEMPRDATIALIDLATTLLATDETLEPNVHSKMIHALFDDCGKELDPETVQRLEWNAEERLATEDRDELRQHLVEAAEEIDTEEQRVASLRLLALLAFATEPTEEEVEFLQVVGDAVDFDEKLVEDIVRAAWETRHGAVDTRVRGRAERKLVSDRPSFLWGQSY